MRSIHGWCENDVKFRAIGSTYWHWNCFAMGMNAIHLANSILLATMQLKFSQAYQAQTSKEMWRRRQLVVQKLLSDAMTENITLPSFRNPVFLQEKWGELSEKKQNKCKMNYLPLDVRLDHQVAPTAVQAYFELHPAILMGLRYSLWWFWMGCCEHEEMSPMDAREQEQQKVGWKGPDTWPVVLGNKVYPFRSLWLVDGHLQMHAAAKAQRKLFPRVVAGPNWFGKHRNDFVCIKPDPGEHVNGF